MYIRKEHKTIIKRRKSLKLIIKINYKIIQMNWIILFYFLFDVNYLAQKIYKDSGKNLLRKFLQAWVNLWRLWYSGKNLLRKFLQAWVNLWRLWDILWDFFFSWFECKIVNTGAAQEQDFRCFLLIIFFCGAQNFDKILSGALRGSLYIQSVYYY